MHCPTQWIINKFYREKTMLKINCHYQLVFHSFLCVFCVFFFLLFIYFSVFCNKCSGAVSNIDFALLAILVRKQLFPSVAQRLREMIVHRHFDLLADLGAICARFGVRLGIWFALLDGDGRRWHRLVRRRMGGRLASRVFVFNEQIHVVGAKRSSEVLIDDRIDHRNGFGRWNCKSKWVDAPWGASKPHFPTWRRFQIHNFLQVVLVLAIGLGLALRCLRYDARPRHRGELRARQRLAVRWRRQFSARTHRHIQRRFATIARSITSITNTANDSIRLVWFTQRFHASTITVSCCWIVIVIFGR